jgi:ferredoxin-NADP reductase
MLAINQIASGELEYLRRLTEEAETRTQIQLQRTNSDWSGWRKFRVLTIMDETETVRSFYLTPHDKRQLPPFLPGQHIAIKVNSIDRHKPLVRCYSLSCAPNSQFYRISVKREGPRPEMPDTPPGLMSNYLHDSLQEGDFVDLKAPSGTFTLDLSQHTPIVLISGGIGITPVFSMLDAVVAQKSNREVWFFAGMRNRLEHPMRAQLQAHSDRHEHLHLKVCYSDPQINCRPGQDYHHQGFVSIDLLKRHLPSNNYDFYFCGPPGMMTSLHRDLSAWGVPANRLHYEAFGPATVNKKTATSDTAEVSEIYKIKFLRSNKTVEWTPRIGSLLDLADQSGVSVESGCRSGNCGTCSTAIRKGEIEYPTSPNEIPDEGTCLLCTAIPRSNLELDA